MTEQKMISFPALDSRIIGGSVMYAKQAMPRFEEYCLAKISDVDECATLLEAYLEIAKPRLLALQEIFLQEAPTSSNHEIVIESERVSKLCDLADINKKGAAFIYSLYSNGIDGFIRHEIISLYTSVQNNIRVSVESIAVEAHLALGDVRQKAKDQTPLPRDH